MKEVVCFGEVLWDLFPEGKKLGGAPLNVALRMKSWGINSQIISGIGNDSLGTEILSHIEKKGLKTQYIQIHESFETGIVTVTLDKKGAASYEINYPVSWDKIQLNSTITKLVSNSDAFVFGSLVARDSVSKKSLLSLLELAPYPVFDVNLRPPHYSIEDLKVFMNYAKVIKFNDEEIQEISFALGFKKDNLEKQIQFISKETNTETICVTLGKEGAILLHKGTLYKQNGYPAQVADTVGAGDSFLGTFISILLEKNNPLEALDKACAMGAMVAQSKGANPIITETELLKFMKDSD